MRESRDQVDFVLYLPDPLFSELSIERRPDVPVDPNVGEMFMEKKSWPEPMALTSKRKRAASLRPFCGAAGNRT
jgi:hypothetical protein